MIPEHYSRDIPRRCEHLIEKLLPLVENGLPGQEQFGGPLKTTFLLALATPMLVLPLERIFKPRDGQFRGGIADDADLDPLLAKRFAGAFAHDALFGSSPLFQAGEWRLVETADRFPVAMPWPASVLEQLAAPMASEAARLAPTRTIAIAIRNALAHGGITYLDRDGEHMDPAAEMLGFASRAGANLRLIRVHKDAFREFLRRWAEWLSDAGVGEEMALEEAPYFASELVAAE